MLNSAFANANAVKLSGTDPCFFRRCSRAGSALQSAARCSARCVPCAAPDDCSLFQRLPLGHHSVTEHFSLFEIRGRASPLLRAPFLRCLSHFRVQRFLSAFAPMIYTGVGVVRTICLFSPPELTIRVSIFIVNKQPRPLWISVQINISRAVLAAGFALRISYASSDSCRGKRL